MFEVKIANSEIERNKAYAIRFEVFVNGLNVPAKYERDELDENGSTHFLGWLDETPIAVARVVVREAQAQIGRVAILQKYRGQGYGKQLMESVIEHIKTWQGVDELMLHAMKNVVKFYQALGFEIVGDEFVEAGIKHFAMKRKLHDK